MSTITPNDTLDTVRHKLWARRIVVMRLGLNCQGYYALGSRMDTFVPRLTRGRSITEAVQKLEEVLGELQPQS